MVQADVSEPLTYNVDQAAAFVGVSRSTIVRAYTNGRLRVRYLGEGKTKPRIHRDDLVAWVENAPTRDERATA